MTRLVWLVLNDGRSVVAGLGSATRDSLAHALARPEATVTLTSDDTIEHISSGDVRDFVVFDAKSALPAESAIYRLLRI